MFPGPLDTPERSVPCLKEGPPASPRPPPGGSCLGRVPEDAASVSSLTEGRRDRPLESRGVQSGPSLSQLQAPNTGLPKEPPEGARGSQKARAPLKRPGRRLGGAVAWGRRVPSQTPKARITGVPEKHVRELPQTTPLQRAFPLRLPEDRHQHSASALTDRASPKYKRWSTRHPSQPQQPGPPHCASVPASSRLQETCLLALTAPPPRQEHLLTSGSPCLWLKYYQ
nr:uncharacterized protein LOC123281183 [Equus asinus]